MTKYWVGTLDSHSKPGSSVEGVSFMPGDDGPPKFPDEEFSSLCLPSPLSQESSRRQAAMSTFRQEDVEDHYEMGEELGR